MTISYFDVWKKKMSNNGGNIAQSRLNDSKDFYNRNFTDDPSYKIAILKKKDINIADSDLDTRVINVDTNAMNKKIYVRPDTNIEVGDYIIYPNKTYLALEVEDNLVSPYAKVTECNYDINFVLDNTVHTIPAIVTNNTKYTLGIKSESSGFIEANGMFGFIVGFSELSNKIHLDQRFIVNGQAWKATQTDHSSTKGILSVLLGETAINYEIDDMDNEIANRWGHNYTIELPFYQQSMIETGTYKINPTIKDNGKEVTNINVMYKSTDESVAIVDSRGLITSLKVGDCSINCSIGDISVDLLLNVRAKKTEEPIVTYEYSYSNGTELETYSATTITFTKKIDGMSSGTLAVDYSLDEVGETLLASGEISITKKADNIIRIKNESVTVSSSFIITIMDSLDTNKQIIVDKQIIKLRM